MTPAAPRLIGAAPRLICTSLATGLMLATLAGCNGATPAEGPGQSAALPAMQSGPVSTGAAGLGPAGPGSAVGSGNLANPGNGGPSSMGGGGVH